MRNEASQLIAELASALNALLSAPKSNPEEPAPAFRWTAEKLNKALNAAGIIPSVYAHREAMVEALNAYMDRQEGEAESLLKDDDYAKNGPETEVFEAWYAKRKEQQVKDALNAYRAEKLERTSKPGPSVKPVVAEIKLCKKCKLPPAFWENRLSHFAQCPECDKKTTLCDSKIESLAAWNAMNTAPEPEKTPEPEVKACKVCGDPKPCFSFADELRPERKVHCPTCEHSTGWRQANFAEILTDWNEMNS
jgi:hypothetical protein